MRQKYRLLKDTPELLAGAIVEEQCDNGDQDYVCITPKFLVAVETDRDYGATYSRDIVMKQPEWFEEVEAFWLPKRLFEKARAFLEAL